MGIFDITVNGVLVHSRKCDTRSYGVPGHLWLRGEAARQNAVWHAINSAVCSSDPPLCIATHAQWQKSPVHIVVRSSTWGLQHSARVSALVRSWFQSSMLAVEEVVDDSSEWNFEITVNGILLHSRQSLEHGFFHDDWSQQTLVWRAISDVLQSSVKVAAKGG